MATVADIFRMLNSMRNEGVVVSYAVCGGIAGLFYTADVVRTFEIEVMIADPKAVCEWAASRGYEVKDEHIYVHGVPVQMLDAGIGLEHEAISTANTLEYEGVPVRVIKPEYIVVIYAKVGGRNHITRALDILEIGEIDLNLVDLLVQKYQLQPQWHKLNSMR